MQTSPVVITSFANAMQNLTADDGIDFRNALDEINPSQQSNTLDTRASTSSIFFRYIFSFYDEIG
jgi:hypothetical protein